MGNYVNDEGWLEDVDVIETPFFSGSINPKYIVLHTMRKAFSESVTDWTDNGVMKESMHLAVGKDGYVAQFAPFTARVWHCGASYYQGWHGLNNVGIGIALEPEWQYPTDEKPRHTTGGYSGSVLKALDWIIPHIVTKYNIRDIVTAHQVQHDTWRRDDPEFPLARYLPYVRYGNANSVGKFVVTSPKNLNVRGGPDVKFGVIDELQPGSGIQVLRQDFEWCFVVYETKERVNQTGWVHESFIRRT